MPTPERRGGRRRPRLFLAAPFVPLLALLVLMAAAQVMARDPDGEPGRRFRPAPEEVNRAAGLERSERCEGLFTASRAGGQPPSDEIAVGCTHGLDLYEPDGPLTAQGGYDKLPPFQTPPGIPCFTSGPYVKVLYVYDRNGTSKLSQRKPLIREIVAQADKLVDDSAKQNGARRHVRWLMSNCNLRVVAVAADLNLDVISLRYNLMARGVLRSNEKGLAFTEGGFGGCAGVAEIYADDRASTSSNRNNFGGMLALVYNGCWTSGSSLIMGTEVATHELLHTLGAVQWSAPNSTEPDFHCTDESDVMCYEDGSGLPMRDVCPAKVPERLDCGRNDYFHPSPSSGSYLATHWNTARNQFLTGGSPSSWDRLDRPKASITDPTGTVVGGRATFTASATAPSGASISEVAWSVDGKYVGSDRSSPYELTLDTFPENGGYGNGRKLKVVAYAVDNFYRWKGSKAKTVTVQNPKVRLLTPGTWDYATGDMPWTAAASAPSGRSVTKVELLVNGSVKSTDTAAPWGGTWNARPYASQYAVNLKVRATDSSGLVRTGPGRDVYMGAPSIELLSPQPWGYQRLADDAVRLAALPHPVPGSTVKRVEFTVNGTNVGSDGTAPYSLVYDTSGRTDGATLSVRARLVDNRGHVATSEAGSVLVEHSESAIDLTTPTQGTTLSGDVSLVANPMPASGWTVGSVTFMVDGQAVGYDYDAPWQVTWASDESWLADGPHVVTAVADLHDESYESEQVESTGTLVTLDNSSATLRVSAPAAGSTIRGKVTFKASFPNSGDLTYVEFLAGAVSLGSCDGTTSCSATWDSKLVHDGAIPVRATAWSPAGELESIPKTFNLANTRAQLKTPAAGATLSDNVTLSASVTRDPEAIVEWVRFYVDGKLVGKDGTGPYSVIWASTGVANGSHKVKAVLVTTDGRTKTSPLRTVTVAN